MFKDRYDNLWGEVPPQCALCGSPSAPWFAVDATRYAFPTDVRPAIVRCRGCRLAWVAPRLVEVAPASAAAASEQAQRAEGPPESEQERACQVLARIQRHAGPGRLLDIGCGCGFFLKLAIEKGWQAVGVNPSAREVEYARSRLGVPVVARVMEEASFPDRQFDVVTLNEVLEHLADPMSVLREAHRVLRPGGLLYIQTPDIDCLEARLLRERWVMINMNSHWFFYSLKPLRSLLERTGFAIMERPLWGRGQRPWLVPIKYVLGLVGLSSLTSITVLARRVP